MHGAACHAMLDCMLDVPCVMVKCDGDNKVHAAALHLCGHFPANSTLNLGCSIRLGIVSSSS
jgi:hypothetical protein